MTAPPAVELRPVTRETFDAVVRLSVADDQRAFVAPNAYSLAQTTVRPEMVARAVHAGGAPVGFVMWGLHPDEGAWWVVRLMVDRAHQGRGYGRAAMRAVLAEIERARGGRHVLTSFVQANAVARRLYESLGFRDTGEVDGGEVVMRWDPAAPARS